MLHLIEQLHTQFKYPLQCPNHNQKWTQFWTFQNMLKFYIFQCNSQSSKALRHVPSFKHGNSILNGRFMLEISQVLCGIKAP